MEKLIRKCKAKYEADTELCKKLTAVRALLMTLLEQAREMASAPQVVERMNGLVAARKLERGIRETDSIIAALNESKKQFWAIGINWRGV